MCKHNNYVDTSNCSLGTLIHSNKMVNILKYTLIEHPNYIFKWRVKYYNIVNPICITEMPDKACMYYIKVAHAGTHGYLQLTIVTHCYSYELAS